MTNKPNLENNGFILFILLQLQSLLRVSVSVTVLATVGLAERARKIFGFQTTRAPTRRHEDGPEGSDGLFPKRRTLGGLRQKTTEHLEANRVALAESADVYLPEIRVARELAGGRGWRPCLGIVFSRLGETEFA